jgi:hypothetical protein
VDEHSTVAAWDSLVPTGFSTDLRISPGGTDMLDTPCGITLPSPTTSNRDSQVVFGTTHLSQLQGFRVERLGEQRITEQYSIGVYQV